MYTWRLETQELACSVLAKNGMACGSDTCMQSHPSLATPAIESSGGSLSSLVLSADQRFPKTSKFTDSFVVHGRWENNTLDAATNLRQRERRLREKNTRKMEQVTGRFRHEVEEVERIQEVVRQRQRRIARANFCACCAIVIQATWRRHHAIAVTWERRRVKLGVLVLTWWRRFTKRRALAVVQRFTLSAIRRRVDLKRKRSNAATTVQSAWRRWVVVRRVRQRVAASAATEVVLVHILGELVQIVYFDSMALVIQTAWRKVLSQRDVQIPKPLQGRFFITQENGPSPHRKFRSAGPRSGATSEPSSSPSRNGFGLSPRLKKSGKGISAGVGSRHPAILGVIASALAARRGTGEKSEDKSWRELPQWNSPLNRESFGINRFRRGCPAAATAAAVSTRGCSQGGRRQSTQPKEIEQTSAGVCATTGARRRSRLDSMSRPPYATVPNSDGAKKVSSGDCSGGGAVGGVGVGVGGGGGGGGAARGGRRSTESFGVKRSSRKPSLTGENAKTRSMTQPRRPSMEKRSSLLGGRRRTLAVALEERRPSLAASIDANNTTAEQVVPAGNVDLGVVPPRASVLASANVLATEVAAEDKNRTSSVPDAHNQPLRNGDSDGGFARNVGEALPSTIAQSQVESSERLGCQASGAGPGLQGREGRGEEYESDSFESEGDMPGAGR